MPKPTLASFMELEKVDRQFSAAIGINIHFTTTTVLVNKVLLLVIKCLTMSSEQPEYSTRTTKEASASKSVEHKQVVLSVERDL